MIKKVNIKTTIQDYKKNKENYGKVAIYDIAHTTIIREGSEEDWLSLRLEVEKANVDGEVYHLVIVPNSENQIRSFSLGARI